MEIDHTGVLSAVHGLHNAGSAIRSVRIPSRPVPGSEPVRHTAGGRSTRERGRP